MKVRISGFSNSSGMDLYENIISIYQTPCIEVPIHFSLIQI